MCSIRNMVYSQKYQRFDFMKLDIFVYFRYDLIILCFQSSNKKKIIKSLASSNIIICIIVDTILIGKKKLLYRHKVYLSNI